MLERVIQGVVGSICLIALVLMIACSQAKDSNKFAANAAQGGLAEVEMGRLASERGADPSVKEFGRRMTADHARAGAELKAIAQRKGIQLPANVDSSQRSELDKLAKLSGAAFDKEYMSAMVKDHETDVQDFETQAKQGGDPDIKAFANKTLPVLKQHLEMARAAAKKIGA